MPPTYVDGKIFRLVEPDLGTVSLDYEIMAFNVKTKELDVVQGSDDMDTCFDTT